MGFDIMITDRPWRTSLKLLFGVLLLSGCASSFFPDFADDTDVIIDDGGKVEYRKINNKGILVADKENAVYEDEELGNNVFIQDESFVEKVVPAKTVSVETEELKPVVDDRKEDSSIKVVTVKKEETKEIKAAEGDIKKADKTDEVKSEVVDYEPALNYLAETIYFDNGSGVVDYKFYKKLKAIAKIAKENNAEIGVYGYASSRTRNTDPASHKLANFKVSAERADNVVKILRKYGVKSEKIHSQALSDSLPMYQEVMPEGERLNRRVEIYLTY